MKNLILTVGLPGSGKTTWAHNEVAKDPHNTTIVCMDDLRNMMGYRAGDIEVSPKLLKERETYVKSLRHNLLVFALSKYRTVICADTNLSEKQREKLVEALQEDSRLSLSNVCFTYGIKSFLDVPIEECIRRDLRRPVSVGEQVIRKMYSNHVAPLELSSDRVVQDESLPAAVICDIDGTLAKMVDRGPFEWDAVGEDLPIPHTINAIHQYMRGGHPIIFMSGRDSVCYHETLDWLKRYFPAHMFNGATFTLLMRKEGDMRKDSIVKEELYREHVLPKFHVVAVFDDRLQVCRLWNRLGLPLFKVGDPDYDF